MNLISSHIHNIIFQLCSILYKNDMSQFLYAIIENYRLTTQC